MLRFADGGGRSYGAVGTSNVNLLAHWTSGGVDIASTWSVSAGNGRTTGSCLRCATTNTSDMRLFKTFIAQATWGIAFAFRFSTVVGVNGAQIAGTRDSSTNQADLRLNNDSTLSVTRNGVVLATSAPLSRNVWYHIEFKVTIGSSAAYEVKLNGVSIIGPSTGNTQATANANANGVFVGPVTGSNTNFGNMDFDDIIVYDSQTTDANGNSDISDFIGDCGVTVLTPSGAGTTTQFTPDSGTNYARLTEATPDTTSYVESSTVGNKDTYAMGDLPANISAVKSIATLHYALKTDVGSRQMGSVVRSGGTNYTHPTGIDLGNSYLYYFRNWGSNPNTATAWTPTTVNALEAGQVVNT